MELRRSLARHYKGMEAKRYDELTSAQKYSLGPLRYDIVPEQIAGHVAEVAPKGFASPEEAVFALARHFSTEFQWKSNYFGKPTVREMLAEGEGNCHVKAALLMAGLRHVGVPTEMLNIERDPAHVKLMVRLPEGLASVDFDTSSFSVTTPQHIWEFWDNLSLVRDIRGCLPEMPDERRVDLMSTFAEGGKPVPPERLHLEKVASPLEKLLLKKALEHS